MSTLLYYGNSRSFIRPPTPTPHVPPYLLCSNRYSTINDLVSLPVFSSGVIRGTYKVYKIYIFVKIH